MTGLFVFGLVISAVFIFFKLLFAGGENEKEPVRTPPTQVAEPPKPNVVSIPSELKITYKSQSGTLNEHQLSLKEIKWAALWLVAYSQDFEKDMIFRLDRIQKATDATMGTDVLPSFKRLIEKWEQDNGMTVRQYQKWLDSLTEQESQQHYASLQAAEGVPVKFPD